MQNQTQATPRIAYFLDDFGRPPWIDYMASRLQQDYQITLIGLSWKALNPKLDRHSTIIMALTSFNAKKFYDGILKRYLVRGISCKYYSLVYLSSFALDHTIHRMKHGQNFICALLPTDTEQLIAQIGLQVLEQEQKSLEMNPKNAFQMMPKGRFI